VLNIYVDGETLITVASAFAIAAASAAVAVRYAQVRLIHQVQADVENQVGEIRDRLREEKKETLNESKIGRYRNKPPPVKDDGYF
jgi:hypothetical protein